jgi:hypothetical protein
MGAVICAAEAPLAAPLSGRAGFARASVCAAGRGRWKTVVGS